MHLARPALVLKCKRALPILSCAHNKICPPPRTSVGRKSLSNSKQESTQKSQKEKRCTQGSSKVRHILTTSVASLVFFTVFPSRSSPASDFPVCSRLLVVAVIRAALVDFKAVYPRDVGLPRKQPKQVTQRVQLPVVSHSHSVSRICRRDPVLFRW